MSKTCGICQDSVCKIRDDYRKIQYSWINNDSISDIYHMIVNWVELCISMDKDNEQLKNLLDRIQKENESINDIVDDFIYGEKYETLRKKYD